MLRSSDFDAHSSALIELMAKDVKHDAELTKAATTIAALREHKEQHAQQLAGLGAGLAEKAAAQAAQQTQLQAQREQLQAQRELQQRLGAGLDRNRAELGGHAAEARRNNSEASAHNFKLLALLRERVERFEAGVNGTLAARGAAQVRTILLLLAPDSSLSDSLRSYRRRG